MLKLLNKINKRYYIILFFFLIYLIFTLPVIFDSNHIIKNLEPYPDALLYSLGARNLASGEGLKLIYNQGELDFWVPPLYSFYLSFFYFFNTYPTTFYIGNLILGLATIFLVYKILYITTKSLSATTTGLLIYFSHVVIFWLPGLAMTENLSLFLFSVLLFSLVHKKEKQKLFLFSLSTIGLLLVRFSILPIILTAFFIFIFQMKEKLFKFKREILYLLSLLITILIIAVITGFLTNIKNIVFEALFNPVFFNNKFFLTNLKTYLSYFLNSSGNLLWLNIGITSLPIIVIFIFNFFIKKKELASLDKILLVLFVSLFPLQLFFYVADARYIIYSIILFSIASGSLAKKLKDKRLLLFFIFAILTNVFFQRNVLREIISNNILHKSTAWQFEAINHFNSQLNGDEYLITALPPFFIDAYQTNKYKILPLSQDQEFLHKKQYVWGKLDYSNLLENYKEMIESGKNLYISNSYITHQHSVIKDFENYKKAFGFELVSEGCLNSCNLFKLNIKE